MAADVRSGGAVAPGPGQRRSRGWGRGDIKRQGSQAQGQHAEGKDYSQDFSLPKV
jgi:hypothetical protein